jgi:hypothetical protein
MLPDLSFLFETPSIWLRLVQALILVMPFAIAVAGLAAFRCGERAGLALALWAGGYIAWTVLPLPAEAAVAGRVVSFLGWLWLVGAWARRAVWHEPLLFVANAVVVALLLALALTLGVATLRDLAGWDLAA